MTGGDHRGQLPSTAPAGDGMSKDGTRKPAAVPLPKHLAHLRLDPRGYPVLVTIPQSLDKPDFGMLSDRRKLAAATFDVCGVCALPFGDDELRWQVAFADAGAGPVAERVEVNRHPGMGGDLFTEAPVHQICGLYAAQVCPFVSSPYARRGNIEDLRGRRRSASVVLLGYDDTLFAGGGMVGADLPSGGQAALMFVMGDHVEAVELASREDANRAYDEALHTERDPVADDLDLAIADHFARDATRDGEDRTATGLAGGAWMIGAAFAPNLGEIVTLSMFADPSLNWMKTAMEVLFDPDAAAELGSSSQFPEVDTAFAWFDAHRDDLPTPLAAWRDHALRAVVRATSAPPGRPGGRGRDPRKAKRKAARSSRRRNRR